VNHIFTGTIMQTSECQLCSKCQLYTLQYYPRLHIRSLQLHLPPI